MLLKQWVVGIVRETMCLQCDLLLTYHDQCLRACLSLSQLEITVCCLYYPSLSTGTQVDRNDLRS